MSHFGVTFCIEFSVTVPLLLAESEEDLNARVNDRKHPNKIHNPNRLSCSGPKLLWSAFKYAETFEEAKTETKV